MPRRALLAGLLSLGMAACAGSGGGSGAGSPGGNEPGILIVHTMSSTDITKLEITQSNRLTDIEAGNQIRLLRVRPGTYRIEAIEIGQGRFRVRWELSARAGRYLTMHVESGVLSYPGALIFEPVREAGGWTADLRLVNRTAQVWPLLQQRYAKTARDNEFRYTGGGDDEFLEWYRRSTVDEPVPGSAEAAVR